MLGKEMEVKLGSSRQSGLLLPFSHLEQSRNVHISLRTFGQYSCEGVAWQVGERKGVGMLERVAKSVIFICQ